MSDQTEREARAERFADAIYNRGSRRIVDAVMALADEEQAERDAYFSRELQAEIARTHAAQERLLAVEHERETAWSFYRDALRERDAAQDRLRAVEAERDSLREALRIGTELDNHHNAKACPYCTPAALASPVEQVQERWAGCSRDEAIRQAEEFHAGQLRWMEEHDKRRAERDAAQERLRAVKALDRGHYPPCTHPDEPCQCSVPLFDLRAALAPVESDTEGEIPPEYAPNEEFQRIVAENAERWKEVLKLLASEDGSLEIPPGNIADTCCGKCPGDTCYVDQVTGA